jgi:hypothetical protein
MVVGIRSLFSLCSTLNGMPRPSGIFLCERLRTGCARPNPNRIHRAVAQDVAAEHRGHALPLAGELFSNMFAVLNAGRED